MKKGWDEKNSEKKEEKNQIKKYDKIKHNKA